MIKKKRGIGIVITIWHGMTIQGLYCYLDMGNNTVTYHKCSHVPNLVIGALELPIRRKIVENGACPCGSEEQSVEHVLFECVNINLCKARRKFEEDYCIYVNTYRDKPIPLKNKRNPEFGTSVSQKGY